MTQAECDVCDELCCTFDVLLFVIAGSRRAAAQPAATLSAAQQPHIAALMQVSASVLNVLCCIAQDVTCIQCHQWLQYYFIWPEFFVIGMLACVLAQED